ncbi:hypothetical protein LCGC14_1038690 [marine sediment metagenome]|uniref:Fumarase C C-terminal domain-containing protein n=1 Tax=marine sediment metagenome TaxID=412755 RepID=A0A0F9QAP0_9ZZZZ
MNRPFDTISKAELMKKHNFTKRNIIVYYFDHEPLGKIIQETRKILNCSRASLVSQSLMLVTALTKDIGYDKAAYIAKKAFKEGKTIRETVLNEGLIPESEIDKKLDLTKMVHLDRM